MGAYKPSQLIKPTPAWEEGEFQRSLMEPVYISIFNSIYRCIFTIYDNRYFTLEHMF